MLSYDVLEEVLWDLYERYYNDLADCEPPELIGIYAKYCSLMHSAIEIARITDSINDQQAFQCRTQLKEIYEEMYTFANIKANIEYKED